METKFTISEVLKTSWQALKSQIWILVGLFIGYYILVLIFSFLLVPAMTSITGMIVGYIIIGVFGYIFMLGYTKNMFQAYDGEEPQFSAYGQQAPKILTFFVAALLMGIAVSIGSIFLVIPGIYLSLRLQFFAAFIIEEDAGIIESLKKSWELTKGQVLQLFLVLLLMMGISIVGILLFVVGVFVAAPLNFMIYCAVFRQLNTPMQVIEE